ncbi:MAG: trypsin-like peptidase domain-containing protein [Gemmatimonadetes bacterium]|nr:trypsin-like peptidase domain-containing protein [Gemmatimonadota bacterium]
MVLSRIADAPGVLPVARTPATIGERVYVIGAPEGLANTISDGLLSGVRDVEERKLLQISAPISSGSSGGPVLNTRGEVIGVSVASLRLGQNLNFAVTLGDLRALLNSPPDRVPFPSAEVFDEPAPEATSDERPQRRATPPRSAATGALEHFAITVLVCGVADRNDVVSCGIQFANTDATGRKNKHLYVDAVFMTDDLGVKSEAEEAQFGSKVGRLKGWTQMLDEQVPAGGKLLLIAPFTAPRLLGTSGTLLLKLSIGLGGSTKDVVITNVLIEQR